MKNDNIGMGILTHSCIDMCIMQGRREKILVRGESQVDPQI